MADVLTLAPLDVARLQGNGRSRPLQRLDPGHLIDRHGTLILLGTDGRLRIGGTDVLALRGKGLIGYRRQPAAHAVRLEVGFFLKSAPPSAVRSTRPDRG